MKALLFFTPALLVGCGSGDDPAALVARIEAASKAGTNLKPDQANRTQEAAEKLGRLGQGAIPAMIEGLGSEGTWKLLAPAFAEIGAPAVAPLTAAVADKNAYRRRGAIEALHALIVFKQIDIAASVPALKTALKDSDATVRRAALTTLHVALGDAADPLLIAALNDSDAGVQLSAAQIFALRRDAGQPAQKLPRTLELAGANRPVPPEAVPALLAALDSDDKFMQVAAAKALGKLGPLAKAAAPRIAHLLEQHGEQKGQNGFGGFEFANALVAIGADAVAPLKGLLESKKADVRARARPALEALARTHPAALDALKARSPER